MSVDASFADKRMWTTLKTNSDSNRSAFARLFALSFRRPWALTGIIASSLMVALLWGANIGTLYPMVEIVFKGDSIPEYIDREIESESAMVRSIRLENRRLMRQSDGGSDLDSSANQATVRFNQQRIETKTASIRWMRRVSPTLHRWLPTTPFRTLVLVVVLLVGGTAIKLVALGFNIMLVQYVTGRMLLDLRALFFRKALSMDLDRFGENGSADLTSRMANDCAGVVGAAGILIGKVVREPLKMITCLCGAMMICPRLLILVAVFMPLMAFVTGKLGKSIRRSSRRAMEEMSQVFGTLSDAFAGIRVVKAYNTQSAERAKFRWVTAQYFRRSMKMSWYGTLARANNEFFGMTTVGLAILGGGYLVVNQQTHLLGLRMTDEPLNVGQMLLFFGLLIGASDPARKLSDVWASLQGGVAAAHRVCEILDEPVRVTQPNRPIDVARPHRHLSLDAVHFAYPSGPNVLCGIDLEIPHGQCVAIVGPNGCGKSTLANLFCRFDDPQSGTIQLDGVSMRDMDLRNLRRRIAIVTQRPVLFDDTIENNIRYGSPRADDHAVVRAAKLARADEFIRHKTPDGYATRLGSGGVRLSGGQMQRIALARAMLRNPDILILDEATSAIDVESETLIHEALGTFLTDRTGIMITHRPSSLALADRIVVIESGRVVDQGTRDDVLRRNRFLQSLCGGLIDETSPEPWGKAA